MRILGVTVAGLIVLSFGLTLLMVRQPIMPAPTHDTVMATLGQRLFLDPRLSPDGSIQCASCHLPTHAFTDGRAVSIGFRHRAGTRNTPSLLNVSPNEPRFWDGRRTRLEVAALDPLVNEVEMGNRDLSEVVDRLKTDAGYRQAFQEVFHDNDGAVSSTHLGMALAAYIHSFPQLPNAYDRYAAGDIDALSPQAKAGWQLFRGKAECAACHDPKGGRFTDDQFHASGVGLGPAEGQLATLTAQALRNDPQGATLGSAIGSNASLAALGRFLVTHQATDIGAFRTPSLRNVALTAPYMHDGSIATLSAAIDEELYYRGLATGRPIALTADERDELLAFLCSLTAQSTHQGYPTDARSGPLPQTVSRD